MATNVAGISALGLQKIVDLGVSCARNIGTGAAYAAGPNSFKDRYGTVIPVSDAKGAKVEFTINPDGLSGFVKVRVETQRGAQFIEGAIDVPTLAAALASYTA